MYDIDYEIYKYINELADQYVELDELLKHNHLTFDEVQQCVKQFKEQFYSLLAEYSIGSQNLVETCYDLFYPPAFFIIIYHFACNFKCKNCFFPVTLCLSFFNNESQYLLNCTNEIWRFAQLHNDIFVYFYTLTNFYL